MTSAEIKTILEEHSKWLENNKNGKCADLRGVNLSKKDLRWADLRWANLRWANLKGADLRDTDLRGVDLRGADLREANLCYPIACPEKGNFHSVEKSKKLYHKA